MATLALPARPSVLTREQVYRSRYLIAFAVTLASVLELVDTSIVLETTLRQQASMVAFEKVFLTMGVTFAAALPLLLLFPTGRVRGGAGAH